MAPTRDLNCHHLGAFLLGLCRDGGKVLIPYKALRIQRSSLLEAPQSNSLRTMMGALAPGCSESPPVAASGTHVALGPRAHLSSSPGCQCGSSWVTCAHSFLPALQTGFLNVQYLNLFFLLLSALESLKNFLSRPIPAEAAELW